MYRVFKEVRPLQVTSLHAGTLLKILRVVCKFSNNRRALQQKTKIINFIQSFADNILSRYEILHFSPLLSNPWSQDLVQFLESLLCDIVGVIGEFSSPSETWRKQHAPVDRPSLFNVDDVSSFFARTSPLMSDVYPRSMPLCLVM